MLQFVVNRNLRTQEDRNIAEQVECLIISKESQFEKFMSMAMNFTSCTHWNGNVTVYEKGYYIELFQTRTSIKGFINNDGNVIRKPLNIEPIACYDVYGDYTEIEQVIRKRSKEELEAIIND